MSLLAAIRTLWHSVAPRTHSDVEEEFRSTLDAYQEDLIRQGLSEEEARRKVCIDLGQPGAQNEIYRYAIGLRLFDELSGDPLWPPRPAPQPWLRRRRSALTGARHRRHYGDVLGHLCRPAAPVSLRRRRPHHEPPLYPRATS